MIQTATLRLGQRITETSMLVFSLLVSVVISSAMFTSTASASKSDCWNSVPPGTIACFWYDINYTGLRTDYYTPSNGCHNFSSTFNDQISSLYNRTTRTLLLYKDINCSGGIAMYSIPPDTAQNVDAGLTNDTASSFKMVSL